MNTYLETDLHVCLFGCPQINMFLVESGTICILEVSTLKKKKKSYVSKMNEKQ